MKFSASKNYSIAKEKFDITRAHTIVKKIEQEKFRGFINNHKQIFSWLEETESGKQQLLDIEKFIIKESILKSLNQKRAFAFYKKDKNYYSLDLGLILEWGYISINFNNSRVTMPALEILIKMADHCDAMLLMNGKRAITIDMIETKG
jgi:hypothetical protein